MTSNKYDFKGIKRLGSDAILGIAASWLSSIGLSFLVTNKLSYTILSFFVEKYVNSLANNGLIMLNVGAINLKAPKNQKAFDEAMFEALKIVEEKSKLTPEEVKEIDDKVIRTFRKHALYV